MKAIYYVSALALIGGACGSEEDTTSSEQDVTAIQHTSDQANPPGTTGFYLLPPMVSTAPTTSGTFNGGYKSRLTVDVLDLTCDTFAVTETPAKFSFPSAAVLVYSSISTYRINSSVPTMGLVTGHCYRVEPKLDGVALGYRDVQVTTGTPPAGVLKWGPTANVTINWGMYGNISPDACPADPNKTDPGICGCGVADTDTDGDGTPDCHDQCPNDAGKTAPGTCGCSIADSDSDGDGVADCNDGCPTDPLKTSPGTCGCGAPDSGDNDGDGTLNCVDSCPNDARFQSTTGVCGCNAYSIDSNEDGTPDTCSNANSCTFGT
jgi:hypothetical protein